MNKYEIRDLAPNAVKNIKIDNKSLSVEAVVSALNELVEGVNTVYGDYLPLSGGTLMGQLSSTSTAIIGEDNIPITDDANIIGKENTTGSKAWYYKAVDFEKSIIYLTD